MPRPDPAVIRVLKEYRAALDAKETGLMQEMASQWLNIEHKLDADISLLAREVADRAAEGRAVTEQMVWRQERYQIVKAQLEEQVNTYSKGYAVQTISTAQRQYALLGIDAAQNAINVQYGPMGTYFTRINVNAVESMIGFAGDGSPLSKLLKADYPDALDGLTKALINGIARGQGPAQTAKDMADGMGMGLERALLIARTESARAYRTGSLEQYRQSGVVRGFKRLVKKETACLACLMLDGETFDLESDLDDHPRGKAELPGNLIVSSAPDAFITLSHNGDIVVIRAASGKFLAITPYHPVLTDRGWIAAKFIKEGDNIIGDGRNDWTSDIVSPYEDHIPTLVEKIPSTFDMLRLGSVPETSKYLNSNREDGQVNVIFANRLLLNSNNTLIEEQVKQCLFRCGDIAFMGFDALSALAKKFVRLSASSRPLLSFGDNSFPFRGGQLGKSQPGSLTGSPMINSHFSQVSSNYIPRNPKRFGDALLRFAGDITIKDFIARQDDLIPGIDGKFTGLNSRSFGFSPEQTLSLETIRKGLLGSVPTMGGNLGTIASEVIFDRVIQVDVSHFSGHVYSLQTREGWYSSNGIISHNCTAVPNVMGVRDPQWQTGEQWFKTLSADEQRNMMGDTLYQGWKDGTFRLPDLAQVTHNDTWGNSPRVATLAELSLQ
jgi:SPP1 gp7 family putative phage head morphogenesis protein